MPEAASTPPVRGSIATTPPRRSPSACTAALCTAVEIVVRTGAAWTRPAAAIVRPPARSSPPGRPRSRTSKIRSRPLTPTSASDGTPSALRSAWRSAGIGPSEPVIEVATGPSGEVRRLAAGERRLVAREERPAGGQPRLAA